MDKDNINFSLSEVQLTSRPRHGSTGSYSNNYSQRGMSFI